MNKILANQIITDCEQFQKDIDSGSYDLETYSKQFSRIVEKFYNLLQNKEIDEYEKLNAQ